MQKILVIQTASIGDVILATALAESLHSAIPGCRIDFLVKKGNEPLFKGHPFLTEVLVWNKSKNKYRNLLNLILKIRKNRYDLVVNVQRFFSSGMITVLSGAGETRGFAKNPLSWLFSRRFPHDVASNLHEVERNHQMISDLAGQVHGLPHLYPRPSDFFAVQQLVTGKCYSISPASLWHTKQYPRERWIELVKSMDADAKVFLLGAPSDNSLCEEIKAGSEHPGVVNMAGTLSLLASAALMAGCRMNFTNDSAPMHLASGVNAPVTAVFCSTVPGFGFGPLSADSKIVEIDYTLPCRPCGLHGVKTCPLGHFKCALDIKTGQLRERLARGASGA